MGAAVVPQAPLSNRDLIGRLLLWAALFSTAALLAGAETAITTLWPWKVKRLAEEEGEGSAFAELQDDITKVLTTALIGVTFCTVYGTALATEIAIRLFGKSGIGYATVALTIATLVLGEIVPKSLAVAHAEQVARGTLPLIKFLNLFVYPVTVLMGLVNRLVLRVFSASDSSENTAEAVTQPELRIILSGAEKSGALELYEQDMIEGVLDMQSTKVGQILTPRVEIEAIQDTASLKELRTLSLKTKYSRIPVYKENVDEIIGVVLTRELLDVMGRPSADLGGIPVSTIMEETSFCPESMTVMNALKEMRRDRLHMMVVVDEFGGTSGVVTLEDILETLVGEIYDEDDHEEVKEDLTSIVEAEDGSFLIDGTADLEVVCEKLGFEVSEQDREDFLTISGYLCQQAGEIPETGDIILVGELKFEIVDADERRLLSVRATRKTAPVQQEEGAGEEADSEDGRKKTWFP
jgi:putative hemolysin